jgi:hypothetical protein
MRIDFLAARKYTLCHSGIPPQRDIQNPEITEKNLRARSGFWISARRRIPE